MIISNTQLKCSLKSKLFTSFKPAKAYHLRKHDSFLEGKSALRNIV